MTRWAISQVRHAMYEPLELCAELGVMPPEWFVLAIVALDKRLLSTFLQLSDER